MRIQKWCKYFLIFLPLLSCHKHKDPGPCVGKKPINASFASEEQFGYVVQNWTPYSTDTVYSNIVKFTAYEEGATYKWMIGSGIYNQQSTTITFPSSFLTNYTIVPVTLIVNKAPDNKFCFPNDNGVDTLTKNIHFVPNPLIFGKFIGSWKSDPSVTFIISINYKQIGAIPGDNGIYLQGFNRDPTCGVFADDVDFAYKEIIFSAYASCLTPSGKAIIGPDKNSIVIDYTLTASYDPLIQQTYTFIGKRL